MFEFDIKVILGTLGVLCVIAAYFPYLRDMFKGLTKPHAYTWLIWFITQGTASVAMVLNGAGWGSAPFIIGTVLVFLVFVLCFKYGTRNITRSDTVILILALLSILLWWQTSNALLAVIMASAIDGFGYLPTYRKLWSEPWSETLSAWNLIIASYIFGILALAEFSVITALYGITLMSASILLVIFALLRRRIILKPSL